MATEKCTQANFCYQAPLLLSQGFQVQASVQEGQQVRSVNTFTYLTRIPRTKINYFFISPTYLGNLCDFPLKIDRESDGNIEKENVSFETPTQLKVSVEEFREIEKLNNYLWKHIFGVKDSEYENSPFEVIEDDSKFLAKATYSELRRQYLLYPSKLKGNTQIYDDKMVKKILKKIKDRESNKPKKIKEKYYQKNLFFLKSELGSDPRLYIPTDSGIILHDRVTCYDVMHLIWHFAFGSKATYNQNDSEHKDFFLRLRENLGLKSFDISQKQFLDFLYSEELFKNTSGDTSGWGKVLRSFVDAYPDKNQIKGKTIMMALKIPKASEFDYNFAETRCRYSSCQQLKSKKKVEAKNVQIVLQDQLVDSGIDYEIYNSFLLMPSILVNVERLAQVREFKLLHKFGFMKNYHLYKALSSTSFDKVMNFETLETLGDTVLKTIITLHLYKQSKAYDEKLMTQERAKIINNDNLGNRGLEAGLQFFLKKDFTSITKGKYTPPGFVLKSSADKPVVQNFEAQVISQKMVADCVEASIGAAILSTRRLYESLQVLKQYRVLEKFDFAGFEKFFTQEFRFDLSALSQIKAKVGYNISHYEMYALSNSGMFSKLRRPLMMQKYHQRMTKILRQLKNLKKKNVSLKHNEFTAEITSSATGETLRNYFCDKKELIQKTPVLESHYLGILQSQYLGYSFKNTRLLRCALSQCSTDPQTKREYERMEFLGDAVIELMTIFLARQVFIFLKKAYTPEMLHMLKPALLSKEGGLTRMFMNLKLHRFLFDFDKILGTQKSAMIDYMKNASMDYKDLWFLQDVVVRIFKIA